MNVHISQLYACSEVELACELYYICELGKYSKILHDKPISLDGIILNSVIEKSIIWDYFRMAVDEGWLVNTGVPADKLAINVQQPLNFDKRTVVNYLYTIDEVSFDSEDTMKRRVDYEYDLRTPVKSQVSFESMTDSAWVWSIEGADGKHFSTNNKSFNHNRADQSWLSLIAMVAIHRLYTGYPERLGLRFSNNAVLNNMAISYIMILDDMTQALTGWCLFNLDDSINEKTILQLGYTAWYAIGRDRGLLNKWYSGKEKYKYMQKLDMQAGDLVMYYERDKAQKMNYIKSIAGCHLAKIKSVSDDSISLQLIHTVKPYFMGKEDFDNHTIAVKKMYINNLPYKEIHTSEVSISLADIGVEYYMFSEKFFITPLDETDDMKVVRVSDGTRKDTLVLDQNNLIYWILKDYDYEFNEERFLKKFFSKEEPVYTRYMRGDVLEDYWYYKEEEQSNNS